MSDYASDYESKVVVEPTPVVIAGRIKSVIDVTRVVEAGSGSNSPLEASASLITRAYPDVSGGKLLCPLICVIIEKVNTLPKTQLATGTRYSQQIRPNLSKFILISLLIPTLARLY